MWCDDDLHIRLEVRLGRKLCWSFTLSLRFPPPWLFSNARQWRISPCDEVLFEALVRRGFAERRKQLRNLLPEHKEFWPKLCAALG